MSREYLKCDPDHQMEGIKLILYWISPSYHHNVTDHDNHDNYDNHDNHPPPRGDLPTSDPSAPGLHWERGQTFSNLKHFNRWIWSHRIILSTPRIPNKKPPSPPWYLWEFRAWAKASFQVDMSPTQNCKSECSGEHQHHHHHHLIFSSNIAALVDTTILHLEKNTTEKFQIPLSAEGCFCQKKSR